MDPELILLIVAGLFILIGTKLWQKGNHLQLKGKKAKAIIFKNNLKQSGASAGMYYPVVRFTTDKQEWITQELNIGYSPPVPEGEQLEVIYDPDDPTTVEINSSFQLEMLPMIFICIGLVGFVTGVLGYLGVIELNFSQSG